MSVLDTLLKVAVIISLAVAASAVSYYYVFYLPHRDAMLDAERLSDEMRQREAEAEQRRHADAAQRALADQKRQAEARYQTCLRLAEANYHANWDSNCVAKAEVQRKSYEECLTSKFMQAHECLKTYAALPTKDCSLPTELARSLNDRHTSEKDRCLREFQLGVQQ